MKLGVSYPSWVNRAAKMANTMQGVPDFVEQEKQKIIIEDRKRQEKDKKLKELKARQGQLKPEPSEKEKNVVLIQINCPGGKKARRRFRESDTIGDVMEFVYAMDTQVQRKGFNLVQTMPRQTFSDHRMSLSSAGLKGRANLFVRKC